MYHVLMNSTTDCDSKKTKNFCYSQFADQYIIYFSTTLLNIKLHNLYPAAH